MEFLTLKPESFGLDISDLSLKFAKLNKKGKFFSLASWGETELEPGIIQDGEIKNGEALARAIQSGLKKVKGQKIRTKNVIVSLSESKAFLQVIQMPKMEEKELKTAVFFEAENYVPLPIDKVYLDFQKVLPIQDSLNHIDILIAAVPKTTINSYFLSLKKAGLKPQALEVESQSISRALIKNGLSSFPVFIVDFGRTSVSFIVFSGYSLRFTTSLPLSSQKLTQAISRSLKVDLSEAEKLKLNYGFIKTRNRKAKEVFEALEPILFTLAEQIQKYINYYHVHRAHEHLLPNGREINKVFLCGRGANLKGLPDFLSKELKIPVEVANPWVNILPEPLREVPGLSFKESLGYTTALGLALRGIEE